MKKSVGLLLLLVCCAPSIIFAAEKPVLKSGNVKIDLIKFDAATPKEFYNQSIYPIEPWFYETLSAETINKINIRYTLYHIAHPDTPLQKERRDYPYPKTLQYLCSETFLSTLTPEGTNVYLSVLADYATTLKGQIEYERQMDYATEHIPQEKRFAMWRILAQHVVFTPDFAAITDGETIKKTFENTLFSILCRDREEAEFLPKDLPNGPLKIYLETVLLKRPTDLDNLVQVLYQLGMSTAPQWTAEQAAAAIGIARLTEGEEKKVEEKKPEQPKEQTKVEEKKAEEKKAEEKKPEQTKAAETKKTSFFQKLKDYLPFGKKTKKENIVEKVEEIEYPEPPVPEERKLVSLEEIIKQEKAKGGLHVSDYLPSWPPFGKKPEEKPAPPPAKPEVKEEEIEYLEPPVPEEGKLATLEEIIKQEKKKAGWHVSDYLPSSPFGKKTKEKITPPPAKKVEEKPIIVKPKSSSSETKIKVPEEEQQAKLLPPEVVEGNSSSEKEKIKVPKEEKQVGVLSPEVVEEESSSSEEKIKVPKEEQQAKILPEEEEVEENLGSYI